jgi:hypothetical protein
MNTHRPGTDQVVTLHAPDDLEQVVTALSNFEQTLHFIGNQRVDINGRRSSGETYCIAHHVKDSVDSMLAVRYIDECAKHEGRWLFARREVHVLWMAEAALVDCAVHLSDVRVPG